MCGILGYLGRRNFDSAAFGRCLDTMATRGPDDRGIYETPEALLGHRRLAILDLSPAGHQPMLSRDGRYVIVYNGEIYNFPELRKELEADGVHFTSRSDTEVFLALYARNGPACLQDLRGMFAVAIWDVLEKALFLARDRMGIKPLYLWRFPDGIAFASEVRALRALPGGPGALEPEAIGQFLLWGSVPEPLTIADGVECLPPAVWTLWTKGSWTATTYWNPPTGEPVFVRRDEVLEALRPELVEATRLCCLSEAPLGAFLSGGIDSSAVVALMRAAGQRRLHTLSLSFPQTSLDEAPYALKVAEEFRTEHTNIGVSSQTVYEVLDGFFAAMDQPTSDGLNTYLISKFAKQDGLTVSLSGLGGDELFGGYPSFRRTARSEPFIKRVPLLAMRALAAVTAQSQSHWRKLAFLAQAGPVADRMYALSRGLFTPSQVRRLLNPDFLAGTSLSGGARYPTWGVPSAPVGLDPVHATMFLELRHYTHNQLLRDSDVFGMANSLEIRVPLLDHKIAELLFQTAPQVLLDESPKSLLIEALPTALPRMCTYRPKMGFTLPFDAWMKQPWRAHMEERLLGWGDQGHGIFAPGALRRLWASHLAGGIPWTGPWSCLALQQTTSRT